MIQGVIGTGCPSGSFGKHNGQRMSLCKVRSALKMQTCNEWVNWIDLSSKDLPKNSPGSDPAQLQLDLSHTSSHPSAPISS